MQKPTIMVVEDEVVLAMELQEQLAAMGYNVSAAVKSGEDAIIRAKQHRPDLVLMDIRLSGDMDGIEAADHLRKKFGVPVVFLTAYADDKTLQRAKLTAPFGYLVKPFSEKELHTNIEIALHKAEMERQLRESEERFRAVFESAEDWVFIKDSDLKYTHVNPAMLQFLGISEDKVIGKTSSSVFGEEFARHLREAEHRVLGGQTVELEHSLTWRGRSMTCDCIMAPMRDTLGGMSGIFGIARDVTERRERERELQNSGPGGGVEEYPSAIMRATLDQMRLAAGTDIIVLLSGESGAGKDYFARYLHEQSPRSGGPFFAINCAAVPTELAESELFGHEAGAFTGSAGRKRGLLELAEGGTLLLNEIGDLSLQIQAKLLSFLDTHTFTRVGGEKPISVDARLIAATNRNLQKEIAAGNFRQDLFYRLSVIVIRIPPLRDRKGDLPVLVPVLSEVLAKKLPVRSTPFIDAAAIEKLQSYDWPGNVRELRNVLERAMIHSQGGRIGPQEISLDAERSVEPDDGSELSFTLRIDQSSSMPQELMAAKRFLVTEGLRRSEGSVKKAAGLLGVTRDAFNYLIRSLGIRKPH